MSKKDETAAQLCVTEIFLFIVLFIVMQLPLKGTLELYSYALIPMIPSVFLVLFSVTGIKNKWKNKGYKKGIIINVWIIAAIFFFIFLLSLVPNFSN